MAYSSDTPALWERERDCTENLGCLAGDVTPCCVTPPSLCPPLKTNTSYKLTGILSKRSPHVFINMEHKITFLYGLFPLTVVRRMLVCMFLLTMLYCCFVDIAPIHFFFFCGYCNSPTEVTKERRSDFLLSLWATVSWNICPTVLTMSYSFFVQEILSLSLSFSLTHTQIILLCSRRVLACVGLCACVST